MQFLQSYVKYTEFQCLLWFHNMKVSVLGFIASDWKAFIVQQWKLTTPKKAVSAAVKHCSRNRNNAAPTINTSLTNMTIKVLWLSCRNFTVPDAPWRSGFLDNRIRTSAPLKVTFIFCLSRQRFPMRQRRGSRCEPQFNFLKRYLQPLTGRCNSHHRAELQSRPLDFHDSLISCFRSQFPVTAHRLQRAEWMFAAFLTPTTGFECGSCERIENIEPVVVPQICSFSQLCTRGLDIKGFQQLPKINVFIFFLVFP